jgi:hypothetical protein
MSSTRVRVRGQVRDRRCPSPAAVFSARDVPKPRQHQVTKTATASAIDRLQEDRYSEVFKQVEALVGPEHRELMMEQSNAITDNLVAAMEDAVFEHALEVFGTIAGYNGNTDDQHV